MQTLISNMFVNLYTVIKKNLSIINQILPHSTHDDVVTDQKTPKSSKIEERQPSKNVDDDLFSDSLFPQSNITIDNELNSSYQATPCSNNQSIDQLGKMIKFNNSNGILNFKFDSAISTPAQEFLSTPSPSSVENSQYSSVSASSSSAASIHSQSSTNNFDKDVQEDHEEILPNSSIFENELKKQKTDGKKDRNKVFTCEYCSAEFKIRGYLTRHIKKHALNKAYECPFFDSNSDHKCHPTGGFSRRDTYKTHLKSRHFKYPTGTRSINRMNMGGTCGLCNIPFKNNEEWIEKHIESGQCEGLPKNYVIRVKNSRKKLFEFPEKPLEQQQQKQQQQQHQSQQHFHGNDLDHDQGLQNGPHQESVQPQLQQQSQHIQHQHQNQQQQPNNFGVISNSFISPISNDSPSTLNNSPPSNITNHIQQQQLLNTKSNESLEDIFKSFNYNLIKESMQDSNLNNRGINDYNDEYSLDIEQSVSFIPYTLTN
ncbi:hypothetical protein WICMUC_005686 [Wickerhamomyces mucosus]|uniref:C2H2-type domain-containing protein n=1 Tax=Wickerhamomyces mucosus TaxID=1378264 RepID=A0A9P8P6H2_9ASCO|nr:hypothetical protein WICMUC_005686 [Wickerhamomyces mucosus]